MRAPNKGLRMRFAVLQRDGFQCVYCGATAKEARLEVDHVIPITRGGADQMKNLVTACRPCNTGKYNKILTGNIPKKTSEGPPEESGGEGDGGTDPAAG